MKKEFHTINNVFSDSSLAVLKKYCSILPSDSSSYDVWPSQITNYNQLPECFTSSLQGKDKMFILNELFNHSELPCAGEKWLKDADIAIQKIVPGGSIAEHRDHCRFSLTIFLSEVDGGEFVWKNESGTVRYTVSPQYNRGIYAHYPAIEVGAFHEVLPVLANTRYTLQLFVFDQENNYVATCGNKYDIYQDPKQNYGKDK